MQDYVNGTIIQFARVREAQKKSGLGVRVGEEALKMRRRMLEESEAASFLSILQWYLDTHFLLICVDKVQNLVKYIAEADGDSKLKELWKEVEPKFKPFNDARNFFEHLDQRIKTLPKQMALSSSGGSNFLFVDGKNNSRNIGIDESIPKLVRDTYYRMLDIFKSRPDREGDWRD